MQTIERYRATNLGEVMQAQGRRQTWLAAQLGVHKSLITHILKGRRSVARDSGERIASLMGVPFFVLFELSDETNLSPEGEAA